jgi:hypothetical protein
MVKNAPVQVSVGKETLSLRYTFDVALAVEEAGWGNSIAMGPVDFLKILASHKDMLRLASLCSSRTEKEIAALVDDVRDVDELTRGLIRTFYRFRGATDDKIDQLFTVMETAMDEAAKESEPESVARPTVAQTARKSGRSRAMTSGSLMRN